MRFCALKYFIYVLNINGASSQKQKVIFLSLFFLRKLLRRKESYSPLLNPSPRHTPLNFSLKAEKVIREEIEPFSLVFGV